jgi:hypothetical protein
VGNENFKLLDFSVGKIINFHADNVGRILLAKPQLTQLAITGQDFRLVLILDCIFDSVDFKIDGISFLACEEDERLVHRQVILV